MQMMKKGGDQARALRYAMGYGAGQAVKNPQAAIQAARRGK